MSTLAILPVSSVASSVDLAANSVSGSQQTTFNNLLNQLQQAITAGNLSSSRALLNALDALPPTGVTETTALSKFLAGVGAALNDGSVTAAQSALSAYQSTLANSISAGSSSAIAPASTAAASTADTIAAGLVQSQLQFNLVSALLSPLGSAGSTSTASSSNSLDSLINFLTAAYGNGSSPIGSPASTSTQNAAPATSPYDTLVSALEANLAAGISTAGPALAYLQSKGSLVSVDA